MMTAQRMQMGLAEAIRRACGISQGPVSVNLEQTVEAGPLMQASELPCIS